MDTTQLSAEDKELVENFDTLAIEATALAQEAQTLAHEAARVSTETESVTEEQVSTIQTNMHALAEADTEAIEALDQLILEQADLIAKRFD